MAHKNLYLDIIGREIPKAAFSLENYTMVQVTSGL